jgi:hypothetical protein
MRDAHPGADLPAHVPEPAFLAADKPTGQSRMAIALTKPRLIAFRTRLSACRFESCAETARGSGNLLAHFAI